MRVVDNAEIVERIKKRAKSKGITMKYLSDQFGLAKTYFNTVANGKSSISDERLEKIATILDTTVEYLTGETEEPEADEQKQELNRLLEKLRTRKELKMLFSLTEDATKEEVEQAVTVIEALMKKNKR